MRILILHVDYFRCTTTTKGRSRIIEDPVSESTEVRDALVVLASVEKQDETHPEEVMRKTVEEIAGLSHKLKVQHIVLHPFAHLFGKLSEPSVAIKILKLIEQELTTNGFKVTRTPFGWFNTLELKAKGHPLSRVARQISIN